MKTIISKYDVLYQEIEIHSNKEALSKNTSINFPKCNENNGDLKLKEVTFEEFFNKYVGELFENEDIIQIKINKLK